MSPLKRLGDLIGKKTKTTRQETKQKLKNTKLKTKLQTKSLEREKGFVV
jgi:hypothetical protein